MFKYLMMAFCLIMIPFTHAKAQEACGEPISMYEIGEADKFCSVYDRQLAYREARIKFRKALEERREDFVRPQLEALKKYEEDLEELNEKRSHDDDFYGR